jgi:uncharacterized membrane protein
MRKVLEAVGIAALLFMGFVTWRALVGDDRLPDRIPTHFDMAGQPNAWGSPKALLLIPAVGLLIYLAISVVSRYPEAFNYPVRVTRANRQGLQRLALEMIAWLKVELACLFAWIQSATIAAARHESSGLSPILLPAALVIVFGTIGWYFVAMRRAA